MLSLVFTMFLPFSPSKESEFRTGRPGEATSVKTAYATAGAEPVMEVSKSQEQDPEPLASTPAALAGEVAAGSA